MNLKIKLPKKEAENPNHNEKTYRLKFPKRFI